MRRNRGRRNVFGYMCEQKHSRMPWVMRRKRGRSEFGGEERMEGRKKRERERRKYIEEGAVRESDFFCVESSRTKKK